MASRSCLPSGPIHSHVLKLFRPFEEASLAAGPGVLIGREIGRLVDGFTGHCAGALFLPFVPRTALRLHRQSQLDQAPDGLW